METKSSGFECTNCKNWVSFLTIATAYRNHCPYCLHSTDIDFRSGDRKSKCRGTMEPIGLTFKHEGKDKYGKPRQGELMLIHECLECSKISINRIAGDDNPDAIINVFKESKELNSLKIDQLQEKGIDVLSEKNSPEIHIQLFGKNL